MPEQRALGKELRVKGLSPLVLVSFLRLRLVRFEEEAVVIVIGYRDVMNPPGAEYVLNLLPKGTHDYSKFIKPSELAAWMRQSELELQHQTGLTYHPFSKQYALTVDTSVNYMLHAIKEV